MEKLQLQLTLLSGILERIKVDGKGRILMPKNDLQLLRTLNKIKPNINNNLN